MYIHKYVYIHVYVHIYIYIYIHIYIYVHICMYSAAHMKLQQIPQKKVTKYKKMSSAIEKKYLHQHS